MNTFENHIKYGQKEENTAYETPRKGFQRVMTENRWERGRGRLFPGRILGTRRVFSLLRGVQPQAMHLVVNDLLSGHREIPG